MTISRVAVIGGGVAGLASAYLLHQQHPEWDIVVLEKDAEPGGKVRSSHEHGYTLDWGPNGFLTNVTETLELSRMLGLESALIPAAESAKKRYLFKNGGLREVPTSPPKLLSSELLSARAKLRLLAEPLIPAKRAEEEESVFSFVARRFGYGAARALAGPFVLGITAGDAQKLSLDALFPRLRELEQRYGSLLQGMIRTRKSSQTPKSRLTSFSGGIGQLTEALAQALGERVRCNAAVERLEPHASSSYRITLSSGETLDTDAVMLATPAFVSARLVSPFATELARELDAIPYADVDVFSLAFNRQDVPNTLDGFGFLVPRGEGLRSLGVLYSSSIFPSQAPEGKVLLRVIAGGSVDPDFYPLAANKKCQIVRRDLRVSMGITAEPAFTKHIPWPRGIPQYLLGHKARTERVMDLAAGHPGLYLTGNAYFGVGVNDCVRDAHRVSKQILADG